MRTVLRNARVLTDAGLLNHHSVIIENGYITTVTPDSVRKSLTLIRTEIRDLQGQLLLPGFIDIQVNGGGGVLFNDDPTVQTIRTIGEAHRHYGTTGFLPTLISAEYSLIEQAIQAVNDAIEQGVPGVLGLHIEGPFLNPERRGVHDARKFRALDVTAMELLTSPKRGVVVVTLAPEMTNPGTIDALTDAGVIVCAGHSNATYAQTRTALEHGLSGFTHLFNAMSPLATREPGMVGAALEDKDSYCSLIVDGHHVAPAALRIALRCKSLDRLILVTDAMATVGATTKSFMLDGELVAAYAGVCRNKQGTLAGSDIDMASAVRNAMRLLEVTLPDAVRLASANPAQFLGLSHERGRIAPGYRADLVLANDEVHVLDTWIAGERNPNFATS